MRGRSSRVFTAETWLREGHAVPVQNSTSRGWPGLVLYRFRDARVDLPEAICTYHEINYVAAGRADMRLTACGKPVEGSWYTGAIGIEPAGMPMAWSGHQDDVINLFLDPVIVTEVLSEEWDASSHGFTLCDGPPGAENPHIARIATALSAELAKPGGTTRLFVESMARMLAVVLIRDHSNLQSTRRSGERELDTKRLQHVQRFVEAHLAEDFGLADLAGAAGLSPVYFTRAFKRTTGMSPVQYRQFRRVERAKRMLAAPTPPLSQGAAATGFSDQAHLTRIFGELTGTTPARYRRALLA
jgi:AraC family transcriptional regulator